MRGVIARDALQVVVNEYGPACVRLRSGEVQCMTLDESPFGSGVPAILEQPLVLPEAAARIDAARGGLPCLIYASGGSDCH